MQQKTYFIEKGEKTMEQITTDNLENYCNQMLEKASEDGDGSDEYHKRYMESLTTLREIEHDGMEYYDKDQRLKLEKEKVEDNKEIELKKQKIGGPRMALELLKIFGPAAIAAAVTIRMQNKAGISEEKGIAWRSEVSKMANGQKPNLWKW